MTNKTSRAMWSRGTMALMMEFNTTCKPAVGERTHVEGKFKPIECTLDFIHLDIWARVMWCKSMQYLNVQLYYSLGTPETSRRGRSTRKARRALTSKPPGFPPCPCIDGWLLSPFSFSSLVKNSKTTLKSLSQEKEEAHGWLGGGGETIRSLGSSVTQR